MERGEMERGEGGLCCSSRREHARPWLAAARRCCSRPLLLLHNTFDTIRTSWCTSTHST